MEMIKFWLAKEAVGLMFGAVIVIGGLIGYGILQLLVWKAGRRK